MSLRSYTRRASVSGALFALCTLLPAPRPVPALATDTPLPQDCPPRHIDERVKVSYVYDGDTVKLSDGRRVRFIGINAPEMGHHEILTQPYAEAARSSLLEVLEASGNILSLQYDRELKDHYGRILAHAYIGDDENVAALLLRQGHATTLVVPPNTSTADCYRQIEYEARSAGRGIWKLGAYQVRAAESLQGETRGFHIVRGRITGIERTKHQVRIALQGMLVARISNNDLAYFEPDYLEKLVDRTVELRGWIKPERGGLGVRVRHPAALVLVGESPGRE